MTDLAEPLVGRDQERQVLEGLLDVTRSGGAQFAVVTGEPGIGKTRLLAELVAEGDRRGFLALEGRAAEFERDLPFGVVIDAFDDYLASLAPHATQRLAGDGLGRLATVFPSLGQMASAPPAPSGAAERHRTYHAVRELLERLAANQPVVLSFDDLHWADDASLELIAHLLRRPPQAGVLAVVSFRTGQAARRLVAAIDYATRRGDLEQIELSPLSQAEAASLLEDLDAKRVDGVYREAGGNPLYLKELARVYPAGATGPGAEVASTGGEVPAAVAAAIAGELDVLSRTARTLVNAASVAGDPFELDLAAAVAGMEEPEALAGIDELVGSGLAHPARVPRRFQFRHPLVRAAVYRSLPPGVRLAAHERAAKALESLGAPASTRAHHLEACARPGDAAAIAVLREAAQAVTGHAPGAAASWFEAALRLLPGEGREVERQELRFGLGYSLAAAGRLTESLEVLAPVLDDLPPEASATKVDLTVAYTRLEHLAGRSPSAVRRLFRTLEAAHAGSAEELRLRFNLAMTLWDAGDFSEMLDQAKAAAAVGEGRPERALKAKGQAILCYAHVQIGSIRGAEAHLERTDQLLAVENEELGRDLDVLVVAAAASFFLERYPKTLALAGRGQAAARVLGLGEVAVSLQMIEAVTMISLGNLERAVALLDDAIDASRLTGNPYNLFWALGWRGFTAELMGDRQLALAAGEESLEVASGLEQSTRAIRTRIQFAATLLAAGHEDKVAPLLLGDSGRSDLPFVAAVDRPSAYELLVEAAVREGRSSEAAGWLVRLEESATQLDLPLAKARSRRSRAVVYGERGDHDAAAASSLEAAAYADGVGAKLEAARARLLAGQLLAAADRRTEAVAELESAETAFVECRADSLRPQATRELRRLGRVAHRPSKRGHPGAEGLEALSAREREVAALVRDRRTNPEIAGELFLSLKTVETHIRNILRKLDVSSRVEVAQLVEREERAGE